MSAPNLPFNYSDFSGGLNTKAAPFLLQDNEAQDLKNVQGTTAGAIVRRYGIVPLVTPTVSNVSIFPLEATGTQLLVTAGGGVISSVTAGGVETTRKGGLNTTAKWEFISAPANGGQGPLWGMNGTDTPQAWDGVATNTTNWTATSGTVPNGKYCITHQNQVFVSGVAATPSRVFWSGLQAGTGALPRDWDSAANNGAGAMDFDPQDGQAISGLGVVGPYVLVAKPRKLWVLVDPATATVRRLSESIGAISHRSIANGPNGTYFLAEDRGVYWTNGSKLEPISDKIQPTIDAVGTQKANAAGAYFNAHYYLSVAATGSGANDTVLDWDETLQSWWKHSFGANEFAVWHPSTSAELFAGTNTGGSIVQAFTPGVYTDFGNQASWKWLGPWQSPSFYRRRRFPTPFFRKRLAQFRVQGTGAVTVDLYANFNSTPGQEINTVVDVGNYVAGGRSPNIWSAKLYGQGVANAFAVQFSDISSNDPASVYEYILYMKDRKDSQP